jgi:hypothetical protein
VSRERTLPLEVFALLPLPVLEMLALDVILPLEPPLDVGRSRVIGGVMTSRLRRWWWRWRRRRRRRRRNRRRRHNTTSPVTIENPPDRDFRTGSEQAANKFPTTSVLFHVGIVEILSCNSLFVE